MKRFLIIFLILIGLLVSVYLPAQDGNSLDWDIDSIFDEVLPASTSGETKTDTAVPAVNKLVKRRGYTFDASYRLIAGFAPGWYEIPWSKNYENNDPYLDHIIKMQGAFGIDAQISEAFRAKSSISFEIPNFSFILGDFFFDYNFYDTVFFRGGKYNLSWGVSPNYSFTNLLSRVPKKGYSGDSFIFKVDVPIGIGGIQALVLTRVDLMHGVIPEIPDFGVGGKYNLAFRWADLDMGLYYKEDMPLRSFLSIKTTIGKTELYNEWLAVIDLQNSSELSGAVNFGFARDFFDKKLRFAGELFYNAEGNAYWYRPETSVKKPEISPFIEGLNLAFNLTWRLGEKGDPRLFIQTLYVPEQNSAQLIPGFRLNPWPNFEFYLAAPMALGSKDGYYYSNTVNNDNKNRPLPFSVMLMVTLNGSVQYGHYY